MGKWMEDKDLEIDNRLRELRKEHDLSQEELAEALGVSRQSIISLEQGRSLPSLPIVIQLCRFFDRAFEDIFRFQREIEKEINNAFCSDKIRINVVDRPNLIEAGKENMIGELEPWRPLSAVSFGDVVDRLLSDNVVSRRGGVTMPKIDIKERKEDFVVKAELPGLKEDEVDIEVTSDGIVTISGEKKEEKEEKEEEQGYFYKESYAGSFSRSFSLPSEVIADKAEADMENGVLTIAVPKARPEKTQKLKVTAKKK